MVSLHLSTAVCFVLNELFTFCRFLTKLFMNSDRLCIYLIPRDVHPSHQDEQGEDKLHQVEGGRKTNLKEYKCHVISIH